MKSVALIITLLTAIATAGATGLLPVTKATVYSDGRPYPSLRMNAPGTPDSAAACAPWLIRDDAGLWHMRRSLGMATLQLPLDLAKPCENIAPTP